MHPETRRDMIIWVGLCALIVGACLYLQSRLFLSWDVSWLLIATERFLHGGTYLHDFFENNPPLILYLYAPVVWVANLFSIKVIWPMRLYTTLLGLLSLGLCYSILGRKVGGALRAVPASYATSRTRSKGWLILVMTGLTLIYFALPIVDFGQREHLSLMLVLPYVCQTAWLCDTKEPLRPGWRWCTSILAGIGFAIKPYFLFGFIGCEVYTMIVLRRRLLQWRLEALIVFGFCLLYLLSIYLITPAYIQAVIPVVRAFYVGVGHHLTVLLMNGFIGLSLVTLVLYIARWLCIKRVDHLETLLLILAAGYFITYLIEGHYWYYHIYPFFGLCLLVSLIVLDELATQVFNVYESIVLIMLVGIFPLKIVQELYVTWLSVYADPKSPINQMIALVKSSQSSVISASVRPAASTPVNSATDPTHSRRPTRSIHLARLIHPTRPAILFMSAAVYPGTDVALYAGVTYGSRFSGLWPLPALQQRSMTATANDKPALLSARRLVQRAVYQDMQRFKPEWVFVATPQFNQAYFNGYPYRFLPFFNDYLPFKRLWAQHYRSVTRIGDYHVYRRQKRSSQ